MRSDRTPDASIPPTRRARRGSALVSVLLLASVLGALSLSALTLGTSAMKEQQVERMTTGVRYVAEAGLGQAVFELSTSGDGAVGSAEAPVPFAGGSFWVERTATGGGDLVSLVSTAELNGSSSRLEVLLRGERVSPYRWAAFADEQVALLDDAFVDSYDPDEGTYASQAVNTGPGGAFAGQGGSVGSNGQIVVANNVQVHGDARPGPGSVTTTSPTAYVSGSTAPRQSDISLADVQVPDALLTLPPLVVPSLLLLPVLPGTWSYAGLDVGYRGTLLITGPAKVVFSSLRMDASSKIQVDATLGPVEIYVLGDFVLGKGVQIASGTKDPADVAIYLAADNVADPDVEIDFDGNETDSLTKVYGSIYAPNAALEIRKDFKLYGSLAARRLRLGGQAQIHYDQGLEEARGGVTRKFETVAWRVLPSKAN